MKKEHFFKYIKNIPSFLVLCLDVFCVIQTFFIAYIIRFNFSFDFKFQHFFEGLLIVSVLAIINFIIVGSYRGIIMHTGLKDALNVILAVTLLYIFAIIIVLVNKYFTSNTRFLIPTSILTIHYLLNIIVLISIRFILKGLYKMIILTPNISNKILIYGAGEMGNILYLTIEKDTEIRYNVVGFIDDDKKKIGKKINRRPIFSHSRITRDFVKKEKIKGIIIAIQKIDPKHLLEIFSEMSSLDLEVKIVPSISEWVGGNINPTQIKNVKIEDLLGRASIVLNNPLISDEFRNKTIFITGAAGSIGIELSKQILSYGCKQSFLIDFSESALYDLDNEFQRKNLKNYKLRVSDIRDLECMENLFKKNRPDIVFHAAAYKQVPLMEKAPYEAVKTNVCGTKNIVDLAVKYNVDKFIMISTDKAVKPTNVMGATKRVSEIYVKCTSKKAKVTTKFITTRFGNVLGSKGSVIPLFKKQIKEGGPLTVTDKEITRFFMTIPEACQLVIEAGSMGKGGEIFIFDMGASIKIFDLAKKMIQLSGLRYPEDIDISITGLRAGEKLYEELLNDGENNLPTYNKKILIHKTSEIDYQNTVKMIEELCNENKINNIEGTVKKIKQIVPEYISKNSIFVELDA